MAKTFKAPFPQSAQLYTGRVTGATLAPYTTTTNMVQIGTAGTEGAVIYSAWGMPRNTCTATNLYLFVSTDGGTTRTLLDCTGASAYTQSTTSKTPKTAFDLNSLAELLIPASAILYAAASVALTDGWDIVVAAKGFI